MDKTIFRSNDKIYKIVGVVDLGGTVENVGENCVLDFQGGTIINGTITLNNTKILPLGCNIQDYITATIEGTYKEGQILYDSTLKKMKLWNGTEWTNLDGTPLE